MLKVKYKPFIKHIMHIPSCFYQRMKVHALVEFVKMKALVQSGKKTTNALARLVTQEKHVNVSPDTVRELRPYPA